MYTVIWLTKSDNRWDRLETKEEVRELIATINNDPDACSAEDVLVFLPQADNEAITGDYFVHHASDDEEE